MTTKPVPYDKATGGQAARSEIIRLLYFSDDIENARLRGPGPYVARPAKDGDEAWPFWYVAGPDGRKNVLWFEGGGGAVLTTREIAEAIANKFND